MSSFLDALPTIETALQSMQAHAIKTLSLFSGAGGLDIGFHQAGFEILACVEIEQAYCKTLLANRGRFFQSNLDVHCVDIRKFDPTPYINKEIECVIGGPPCQTFSAAGRRSGGVLGTMDDRGRLFESYCAILEAIQPKVFVFENVYGLPGANGGGPWREIQEAFSKIGYSIKAEVLDTADFGVPQHRERLIIVGWKDRSSSFEFPEPTHGPDSSSGQSLFTVGEAIADLQRDEETFHELGGLYGHLLPLVPEGLNYSFFTREMGYPRPYFAWRSKFSDFLYKADRNAPCRTLKAQPGKFTGPFHWKNRHFTTDELKRLQTFPDEYIVVGTYGKVMEQIGNSVPSRLAYVIAQSVKDQLLRPCSPKFKLRSKDFRPSFRQRQRDRTAHYRKIALREISARFASNPIIEDKPSEIETTENFRVSFDGLFGRTVCTLSTKSDLGRTYFSAEEKRIGDSIELIVKNESALNRTLKRVSIEITGLKKYLIDTDSLYCDGHIASLDDVFRLWSIIELVVTKGTQFFTLIDIYGHYANRGDTVKVTTRFNSSRKSKVHKAIEFFGSSKNCGDFVSENQLSCEINLSASELPELIAELRSIRWDVRTALTHPTIRTHDILCTYPFPLLSDKAQLERRLNARSQ